LDINDIQAQATIRYLLQIKHWPLTPDSDFARIMDRFFGEAPGRTKLSGADYQEATAQIIKSTWGYECVAVVPVVREEKLNPGKPTRRPKMIKDNAEDEGETGSKTFKSINQLDDQPA
jgi:hypothetical protein